MRLQPPRGTHDLIGEEMVRYRHIVETGRRIFGRYGFEEWATPIFEDTGVFARSLGETSDVVSKEMYNFQDRGGDSLTLRPEGTAAICRALVSNALTQSLPQKVFYQGPMFRYERPQKGRFRQFHQIGTEYIGAESPLRDAETITMARDFLRELGLLAHVRLELNTLGDRPSRQAWREALVDYFRRYENDLSEDSRTRLEVNPLRILDSKDERDRKLLAGAPPFRAFLNEDSQRFWTELSDILGAFGVEFVENPHIVRGLDYYSHTAFEFVTDRLGAQGTVLAGGRYEGLIEEMGGPSIPAIGWAAGIERLSALIDLPAEEREPVIAVLPMGELALMEAAKLTQTLRDHGFSVTIETRGNMKKRMERVVQSGASYAVFMGEDEVIRNIVQLRNLTSRVQQDLRPDQLLAVLKAGE